MNRKIKFKKLELKHLNKNIIGKYIKDSNVNEFVKVLNYYTHPEENFNCVYLEKKYKNYDREIDDYMLLRNFDIEIKED